MNRTIFALSVAVILSLCSMPAFAAEIRSVLAPANCLDLPRKSQQIGAAVLTWTCNGGHNQDFAYNSTSREISIYGGTRCLSSAGANGSPLVLAACLGASAPSTQKWNLSGSTLVSVATGRCVDIARKSTATGASVITYDCHGGTNQAWTHALGSVSQPTTTTTRPSTTTTTTLPVSQGTPLRVMQWNVADGESPGEITVIVNQRPDVVMLQEVDYVAQIERIRAALAANQGVQWYATSINRDNTTSGHSFLAILSKYPLANVQRQLLGYEGEVICGVSTNARTAIGAEISVAGRSIAVVSTRNYWHSSWCPPQVQNRRMKAWADRVYAGRTHIYAGDFNHNPGTIGYNAMTEEAPVSTDAWYEAVLDRAATAVDDDVDFHTKTKSYRLDYVFYRNNGTALLNTLRAATLGLTSDSDHRPVVVDLDVR